MDTNQENTTTPISPSDSLFKLKNYLKKFWKEVLDLEHGVDKRATINEIKDKKSMSGPNAWMLMCSIVIASVGLDMNSPAVIIGAMLISPLMSPILGMGLAIGINDKETLKKSLSHFGMAVFIAIMTSTIYFALTPLGELTSQISARTEPTPLDIFIAFFGGIAGIVSIARKDISTTLPGVAIATALMPPVCVVGYGIATGKWDIALSSFFLFFINTVFVSFATYLIVKFVLHFPQRDFADDKEKKKNTAYIAAFLLTIVVVSYFPFRKILRRIENRQKVEQFVQQVFEGRDNLLDGNRLLTHGDSSLLVLKVYGDGKEFESADNYQSLTEEIGLKNTKVKIVPTTNINEEDLLELDNKIESIRNISDQLSIITSQKASADTELTKLQDTLSTYCPSPDQFYRMTAIVKSIDNQNIEAVSYAKGQTTTFYTPSTEMPIIIVEWKRKPKNFDTYKAQIYDIMKADLRVDTLKVAHVY